MQPTHSSLTSLREEPGVDGVEALLRDETRGALRLEAAVDALHLGHVETAAETRIMMMKRLKL